MKNKKKLLIPLLIILMASIGAYTYYRKRGFSDDPDIIRLSGNIEVTEAELSFMVAGRVEDRPVSEGETVRAGQVVAWLESTEFDREVALRKAEVQVAQALLAELVAGSRPEEIAREKAAVGRAQARLDELLGGSRPQEVAAAKAAVQRMKAESDRAEKDHERLLKLYRKEVISAREYETAQASFEAARARLKESEEQLKLVQEGPRKEQIEQAREALKEARERLALVEKGPRKETIDQASARLRQAQEAQALAETRLAYTTLISPLSGVVLSQAIEPGERVTPGTPVVTVGDLKKVYLRTYVNETDLGRVKIGQRVQVTTDTYPGKIYEGRISFISPEAEFTPKNVQTETERVKLVFRLKVDIPNPNMELKPGMPADAQILTGQG
ncbi:MAG: efflux RND transporter periplasmic adaptor subunit [bacterium]